MCSRDRLKFPVYYSSNGDDIDRFAQKTKAEFALIYHLLNALRQNFSCKSQPADTLPFQWYVDVLGGKIYMRNSKDDGWNVLGNSMLHFELQHQFYVQF